MVKSTYVLDVESADALERLAREWQVSKSEALRRAIKSAAATPLAERPEILRRMQEAAGLSAGAAARWSGTVRSERRAGTRQVGTRRR